MSIHHRTHYYQSSDSTWEREYILWMKAKDDIKRFYKNYPHHLDV